MSIPMDSKFGLAWRDWRVLTELARRTGHADYPRPRRTCPDGGQRAADRRIEKLQDRINRLHAWFLLDREQFANKIKRENGALCRCKTPTAAGTKMTTDRRQCGLHDGTNRRHAAGTGPAAR